MELHNFVLKQAIGSAFKDVEQSWEWMVHLKCLWGHLSVTGKKMSFSP